MHRKAKTTAVPVEQEQQGVSEDPVELNTDAEQMTDIINEVSVATEPILETEYEQHYVLTTPIVPKAKAKRAPSCSPSMRSLRTPVEKPKVIEPEVEVQADVTLPTGGQSRGQGRVPRLQ